MYAEQPRRRLPPHRLDDARPPISTLRDVAGVPQPLHENIPRTANALQSPARLGWSLRKAVARQRWDNDVEGVFRPTAERGRIGEWADELDLLEHGPRPAMRDDHRQCVRVPRAD